MNLVQYIIVVSVCLGFFYITYAVISRKTMNFRHARFYLLASIFISLLIPLSDFQLDTGFTWPGRNTETVIIYGTSVAMDIHSQLKQASIWERIIHADPVNIVMWVYLSVTAILLARVILMLALLSLRYYKAFKVHLPDYVLLYNHGFRNTFSFFRWIFIHPNLIDDEDLKQIIAHEKVHVSQYHSLDILLIELLTAVMWFNPFVWMMKNSIQLVHEYLADDGALDTGINRFKYQALLINQVAEERLVVLSSSFNNSLIKKRITMMTKTKIQRKSVLKLLALLPVATLLFLLVAIFNGIFSENVQAAESATFSVASTGDDAAMLPSPLLPPDTIIKKTTIKKINKDNPKDTIVIEKEEIIVDENVEGDVLTESDIVRHRSGGRSHVVVIRDGENETLEHRSDGERREVRIRVESGDDRRMHVSDSETIIEDGDTIKHVKVIKHRDGDGMEVTDDKKVIIRNSSGRESDILYIIDGEQFSDNEAMNNLDPDEIQSMSVYKGETAKKYTDKDYEGVIVIVTKNGKKK